MKTLKTLIAIGVGTWLLLVVPASYFISKRLDPYGDSPRGNGDLFVRTKVKQADGSVLELPAMDEALIEFQDGTKRYVKRPDAEQLRARYDAQKTRSDTDDKALLEDLRRGKK
ncbi:MAG: hypothetical protein JNJ83_22090 [Verrucomicrobiaceae bacterium]|nr:hypothetical protein [Verrucomicrobiaceae bacterium]